MFNTAEISNFAAREREEYIQDMTTKRDIENQLAFARNDGHTQGFAEGMEKGVEKGMEKGKKCRSCERK